MHNILSFLTMLNRVLTHYPAFRCFPQELVRLTLITVQKKPLTFHIMSSPVRTPTKQARKPAMNV